MKNVIKNIVINAAQLAFQKGLLQSDAIPDMEIEAPRHENHGDFSTNFAMISASIQKMAPRKIAEIIKACIEDNINSGSKSYQQYVNDSPKECNCYPKDGNESCSSIIAKIEIAGPGFINFFLTPTAWYPFIQKIHNQGKDFGRSNIGRGKKVQVEFVSANPTGPLHIGHGRGAAVGDAVGNILAFSGFDVQKEYYINDSGRQIRTLGRSVWLRLCQLVGKEIEFPEDCYQGDYIQDIAKEINDLVTKKPSDLANPESVNTAELSNTDDAETHLKMLGNLFDKPEAEAVDICAKYAADKILQGIKDDLYDFGVEFDRWFSEQSLYDSGKVQDAIKKFQARDVIYEKDGALWFKTESFGDEKDRVVVRNNGLTTYFASDIAYHTEKFDRGFDRVIDVWGADHHGYIDRINAAIEASGRKREQFDVILVQLVNLLRGGQPVAMSTRSGEFVTLKEIVDEVGKDAARFIFLSRSYDSGLDFDLEVAKQQTADNPVYYVQYVHARITGIVAKACEQGVILAPEDLMLKGASNLECLVEPEELKLIKILASFTEVVEKSALALHPHLIFTYLMLLASAFHGYYNKHKVITEHQDLTLARLCLISSVKKVIHNGLTLLGVSAPERM
ncbi:MAG: arginine--tRNA ligase [Desulfamplus sp.]|nr:arginine--tRNA ligase [Desulfamplus sp.]